MGDVIIFPGPRPATQQEVDRQAAIEIDDYRAGPKGFFQESLERCRPEIERNMTEAVDKAIKTALATDEQYFDFSYFENKPRGEMTPSEFRKANPQIKTDARLALEYLVYVRRSREEN